MAVAFISAGRGTPATSGTTVTAAITRGAANYIVFCALSRDNSVLNTGATYDGNAATALVAAANDGGVSVAVYGYPLTTDGNAVVSYSAINNVAWINWALFSGVDTASPTIDTDNAGEIGTDLDIALTGGSANDMQVITAFLRSNSTMSAETGTTMQDTGAEAGFGSTVGIGTAAGNAASIGFNLGAAAEAYGGGLILRASGAGAAPNRRMMLLGVG